jgi:hypothetical protein
MGRRWVAAGEIGRKLKWGTSLGLDDPQRGWCGVPSDLGAGTRGSRMSGLSEWVTQSLALSSSPLPLYGLLQEPLPACRVLGCGELGTPLPGHPYPHFW